MTIVGRLRVGARPDDFGLIGATGAEWEIEVAPEGMGGASDGFVRTTLRADVRVSTFLRRRMLPNVLDVAVTASHGWGPRPPQRWSVVDATGRWSSFGTLRTLVDVPYEGSSHVQVAWEHHFRTVPFELIGAYGLARRNYGLILTAAHGRTWLDARSAVLGLHGPVGSPGWHHEVGLSLSGVLRLFRLDATLRLDAPGWRFGIGTARLF